jgi:hypothetical protein
MKSTKAPSKFREVGPWGRKRARQLPRWVWSHSGAKLKVYGIVVSSIRSNQKKRAVKVPPYWFFAGDIRQPKVRPYA